jgi:hypothetical protein
MKDINVFWDGPFTIEECKSFHSNEDYGLYQYYGEHLAYGQDSLLYLGKAAKQTFGKRLPEHNWEHWCSSPHSIYLGRIFSDASMEPREIEAAIDIAERILLLSHNPSFNSSNLNRIGNYDGDVRILNWGLRRQMLPEVSISRWEGKYNIGNYLRPHFKAQTK